MKTFIKQPVITWLVLLLLLAPFWWLATGGGREIALPLFLAAINAYFILYALLMYESGNPFLCVTFAVSAMVMFGFAAYRIAVPSPVESAPSAEESVPFEGWTVTERDAYFTEYAYGDDILLVISVWSRVDILNFFGSSEMDAPYGHQMGAHNGATLYVFSSLIVIEMDGRTVWFVR